MVQVDCKYETYNWTCKWAGGKCVSAGRNARTLSHIQLQNMEIAAGDNSPLRFQPFHVALVSSDNDVVDFLSVLNKCKFRPLLKQIAVIFQNTFWNNEQHTCVFWSVSERATAQTTCNSRRRNHTYLCAEHKCSYGWRTECDPGNFWFPQTTRLSSETAIKRQPRESDGFCACGCHRRFLNAATEIRSTGRGGQGCPPQPRCADSGLHCHRSAPHGKDHLPHRWMRPGQHTRSLSRLCSEHDDHWWVFDSAKCSHWMYLLM